MCAMCSSNLLSARLGWIIDSSYNDARYFTGQAVRAGPHPNAFQLVGNLNIQMLGCQPKQVSRQYRGNLNVVSHALLS